MDPKKFHISDDSNEIKWLTGFENSIDLQTSYEWIPFSINDSEELIFQKTLLAIDLVKKQITKPIQLPFGGIVLVGILAFFAGLAIGSSTISGNMPPPNK